MQCECHPKDTKNTVSGYISLPPDAADPTLDTNNSWYDTKPARQTEWSEQVVFEALGNSPEKWQWSEADNIATDTTAAAVAGAADTSALVGWHKVEVVKLFMPKIDEHRKDAIPHWFNLFHKAHLTSDGYKKVTVGGNPHNNASETDKMDLTVSASLERSMHSDWRRVRVCSADCSPKGGQVVLGSSFVSLFCFRGSTLCVTWRSDNRVWTCVQIEELIISFCYSWLYKIFDIPGLNAATEELLF